MPDYAVSTSFTAFDRTSGVMKNMTSSITKYGAEAERSFDKAARSSARAAAMQERMHKVGSGLKAGSVAAGTVVAQGLVSGFSAGFQGIEKIINSGDQLNDTAQALGLTTKALQEYHYVAELSGVETEAMDKALTKLTVGLGKGDQAVIDALSAIGVGFDQVKNANPDQVLEAVAQGFKNTEDSTTKAAAATALFGKSNVKMVNALSGGAEGLKELRDEAHKTGYVMSDELIKASAENDDQMHRLQANFRGVTNQLGSKLIPVLTKGANSMIEFLQANKAGISAGIEKFFDRMAVLGQKLGPIFKKLAPIFDKLGEVFDSLMPVVGAIADIIAEIIPILGPVIDLVKQLANTVGKLLVNALGFLKPIIATVIRIFETIGPIVGRIVDKFGQFIGTLLKALGPALEKLLPVIEKVLIVAFQIAEPIITAIFDVLSGLATIFGTIADVAMTVLGPAINWLMDVLRPVGKFIDDIINGIKEALVFAGILKKEDLVKPDSNKTSVMDNPGKPTYMMMPDKNSAGSEVKIGAVDTSMARAVVPPNQREAEARQQNINFNGQLNIAGAPAGSTMQSNTSGAKPIRTDILGVPAR